MRGLGPGPLRVRDDGGVVSGRRWGGRAVRPYDATSPQKHSHKHQARNPHRRRKQRGGPGIVFQREDDEAVSEGAEGEEEGVLLVWQGPGLADGGAEAKEVDAGQDEDGGERVGGQPPEWKGAEGESEEDPVESGDRCVSGFRQGEQGDACGNEAGEGDGPRPDTGAAGKLRGGDGEGNRRPDEPREDMRTCAAFCKTKGCLSLWERTAYARAPSCGDCGI